MFKSNQKKGTPSILDSNSSSSYHPTKKSVKMLDTKPTSRKRRVSLQGWLSNHFQWFGRSNSLSSPKLKDKANKEKSSQTFSDMENEKKSTTESSTNSTQENDVQTGYSFENISVQAHSTSQSQPELQECSLCMGEYTLESFPVLSNCLHLFCIECLHTYTKLEIQEGRVDLKCPQCDELIHPNDIALFLGESHQHLLSLYESLMLRRTLVTDPDTRWCPRPDCPFVIIAKGRKSNPEIKCEYPGCGYSFCYNCKTEWHPKQTCDSVQRNNNLESHLENASESQKSCEKFKPCPNCQVLTEKIKDGSCNHMTCSVCGTEFCWLCMKEITELHFVSPSGCTFWGKKTWSWKKKCLFLMGAPLGITLLAGMSIPIVLIGFPTLIGRKIHKHYKRSSKTKRKIAMFNGVVFSMLISPLLASLVVAISVPALLGFVYGYQCFNQ